MQSSFHLLSVDQVALVALLLLIFFFQFAQSLKEGQIRQESFASACPRVFVRKVLDRATVDFVISDRLKHQLFRADQLLVLWALVLNEVVQASEQLFHSLVEACLPILPIQVKFIFGAILSRNLGVSATNVQLMLLKLVAETMCKYNHQVHYLSHGCIDFVPCYVGVFLSAAETKATNCTNLVDS